MYSMYLFRSLPDHLIYAIPVAWWYHVSLFSSMNSSNLFPTTLPHAQALGRINGAHRCGRYLAPEASDGARRRNVLHNPRFRSRPGNGVRREGPIDKTYRTHVASAGIG